jgi:hypothetical protein
VPSNFTSVPSHFSSDVSQVFAFSYKANETMVTSDHLELLAQVEAEDDILGDALGKEDQQ